MKFDAVIRKSLKAKLSDITSWPNLLFFFAEHQDELSWFQKVILYRKCEKYRLYSNIERMKKTTIMKNEKEMPWTVPIASLDIQIRDVKPSDIYRINKKLKFLAIFFSPHLLKLKIHDNWQNNT